MYVYIYIYIHIHRGKTAQDFWTSEGQLRAKMGHSSGIPAPQFEISRFELTRWGDLLCWLRLGRRNQACLYVRESDANIRRLGFQFRVYADSISRPSPSQHSRSRLTRSPKCQYCSNASDDDEEWSFPHQPRPPVRPPRHAAAGAVSSFVTFRHSPWCAQSPYYKVIPESSPQKSVDSTFPGNSPWTRELHPSKWRFCLSQSLWSPESRCGDWP